MANSPKQIHQFDEFTSLESGSYVPASKNALTGKITVANLGRSLRWSEAIALSANYQMSVATAPIILFTPDADRQVTLPPIVSGEFQEYEIYSGDLDFSITFLAVSTPIVILGGNSGYSHCEFKVIADNWIIKPGGF